MRRAYAGACPSRAERGPSCCSTGHGLANSRGCTALMPGCLPVSSHQQRVRGCRGAVPPTAGCNRKVHSINLGASSRCACALALLPDDQTCASAGHGPPLLLHCLVASRALRPPAAHCLVASRALRPPAHCLRSLLPRARSPARWQPPPRQQRSRSCLPLQSLALHPRLLRWRLGMQRCIRAGPLCRHPPHPLPPRLPGGVGPAYRGHLHQLCCPGLRPPGRQMARGRVGCCWPQPTSPPSSGAHKPRGRHVQTPARSPALQ